MSPTRTRTPAPDAVCAAAVDLASDAAAELAGPGGVGMHVGVAAEDERVVTHFFEAVSRAYAGWRWAVTVSRASRSRAVTVCEVVLLPGPDSLLAPDWVPWSERVRPGDLGVGDLMPASSDDERLVPLSMLEGDDGVLDWAETADLAEATELADALGISSAARTAGPVGYGGAAVQPSASRRSRVLSASGRDMTAIRWYSSEHGPGTPLARAAPGPCATCGFLTPLAGPLGQLFGACANEYAPDDGRVVSLDHGCGAHSEALLAPSPAGTAPPVIDEVGYDLVDMPGVALADTVFESLDHESGD